MPTLPPETASRKAALYQADRARAASPVAGVEVAPGNCFERIARQTSGATNNAAANELAWFAMEVVE